MTWERVVASEESEWSTSVKLLLHGGMHDPTNHSIDLVLGDSQFSTIHYALPYNRHFLRLIRLFSNVHFACCS